MHYIQLLLLRYSFKNNFHKLNNILLQNIFSILQVGFTFDPQNTSMRHKMSKYSYNIITNTITITKTNIKDTMCLIGDCNSN